MSKIRCPNLAVFCQVCAALVREGVTFDATADSLTITLTGGF